MLCQPTEKVFITASRIDDWVLPASLVVWSGQSACPRALKMPVEPCLFSSTFCFYVLALRIPPSQCQAAQLMTMRKQTRLPSTHPPMSSPQHSFSKQFLCPDLGLGAEDVKMSNIQALPSKAPAGKACARLTRHHPWAGAAQSPLLHVGPPLKSSVSGKTCCEPLKWFW